MAVLLSFFIPSGFAQDPMKELTEKANTGFINFSNAQYEAAVGNFEEVIKGLGPMAKGMKDLEGLYFTLAASYFNLNNYQKALLGFQTFQTDYPKSERIIDSTMAIAQCQLLLKNYGEAEKLFTTLENIPGRPDLREQAIFLEATAYRDDKQHDKAIEKLETLIKPQIKTPMQANGGIMLTQLLTDTNPKRAVEVLLDLERRILLVENVVTLNQLAVRMGDAFYNKKLHMEAFTCYRAVKLRNDVLKIQQSRINALEAQIENNKVRARQDPANFTRYIALNAPIQSAIAAAKKMYEEMQKLPDYGPGLYIRMANCYYELGKKWESVVVYDDLLLRFPGATPDDRENAMFAMVAILTETAGPEEVDRVCSLYLKEFPNGKNKDTVGFFTASSQLQLKDPDFEKTEGKLKQMLDSQKESKYRAEMLFQLGYARFMQGKFDLALADFRKYQDQYGGNGSNAEDVHYLAGVCLMFSGKIDDAARVITSYAEKYPGGSYITDAKYRLCVLNLSYAGAAPPREQAKKYQGVVDETQAWEKEFAQGKQLGDVLATQGDAYIALDKNNEAIESYIRSWKAAQSEELLSYSLFEASKWLQKKGDWERIGKMFQEFVQLKGGDHPAAPTALFWIGRAKARMGKVDEAKAFMAETVQKYIADKHVDAVEMLLGQLAMLVGKKKPAHASPSPAAAPAATPLLGVASTPPPVPTPTPAVIGLGSSEPVATPKPTPEPLTIPLEELEKLLATSVADQSPVVQARLLFAKAALAEFRKNPEEHDKFIAAIAERFQPDDLSAVLLAQIGDYYLNKGDTQKAAPYYNELMDNFAKSDTVEYAYAGLGEIAFQKKDYDKALEYFVDAIEKIGAGAKLKDVMVGKAKTLYEKGKLDEALKIYKQIAGVREWRGETTAYCLYMIGEIQAKQEKYPEAIGSYQKVFVAHQRYLTWVAKSYLRAADCFVKLNEPQKAVGHLQEMMRNKKLEPLPEYLDARKKLAELASAAETAPK